MSDSPITGESGGGSGGRGGGEECPPNPYGYLKNPDIKTLWFIFVDGMQLLQDYTEPLRGDSSLFTRNSWYLLNQSRTGERLRWLWSHPVVLNLCINLVITKYKLRS